MQFMKRALSVVVCLSLLAFLSLLGGCASQWKIQGGPKECAQMCAGWGMELSGMVGVGNQDAGGPGATACVCEVKRAAAPGASAVGSQGTATGMSAAIVAMEEAQRQQQQQAQAAK